MTINFIASLKTRVPITKK